MSNTLYLNATLDGHKGLTDIYVKNGRFEIIRKGLKNMEELSKVPTIDLNGLYVTAPLVESHIHLDYVYSIEEMYSNSMENKNYTLFDGISSWSGYKEKLTNKSVKDKIYKAIRKQILSGIQHVRTHIDIGDPDLIALEAMLEIKEELSDLVDIQIVAFPQEGIYGCTNTEELLEEALLQGADAVGAIPHYEFTRELGLKSLDKVVALALKYGKMLDIHCDEIDDSHSRFLETLATKAMMEDIGDLTTASHTCALGSYNNAYAMKLERLIKVSGINYVVCPIENIHLQGRGDSYPKRRGLTRMKELLDLGANISLGQDSIADPWYPMGNGNLINVLDFGVHISQLLNSRHMKNAMDLITYNGAKTLNISDRYGIEEKKEANFIIIDAKSQLEVIQERAPVVGSARNGKVLFKKELPIVNSPYKFLCQKTIQESSVNISQSENS